MRGGRSDGDADKASRFLFGGVFASCITKFLDLFFDFFSAPGQPAK